MDTPTTIAITLCREVRYALTSNRFPEKPGRGVAMRERARKAIEAVSEAEEKLEKLDIGTPRSPSNPV